MTDMCYIYIYICGYGLGKDIDMKLNTLVMLYVAK